MIYLQSCECFYVLNHPYASKAMHDSALRFLLAIQLRKEHQVNIILSKYVVNFLVGKSKVYLINYPRLPLQIINKILLNQPSPMVGTCIWPSTQQVLTTSFCRMWSSSQYFINAWESWCHDNCLHLRMGNSEDTEWERKKGFCLRKTGK